ncbi:uncharacterized protein LOC129585013 isoform X2 [Paramacrobiotus metropolitanus]|uniref:uncharacterized protein LOC129585013 isoform X2 n=1 Tax=Paramacrobiotus metropolitanus TaxID=2943436 RepID=UPI002445C799|nr:uncharacterized protein LOC129585013 isoform X2 [Paramacrobiotus metropolitanus]
MAHITGNMADSDTDRQKATRYIPLGDFFGFVGKTPSAEEKERLRKIVRVHVILTSKITGIDSETSRSPYPNQLAGSVIDQSIAAASNNAVHSDRISHSPEDSVHDTNELALDAADPTPAFSPGPISVERSPAAETRADAEVVEASIDSSCYDPEGFVLPFASCVLSVSDGTRMKNHVQYPDGRFMGTSSLRKAKSRWMQRFDNEYNMVMFGEVPNGSASFTGEDDADMLSSGDHSYSTQDAEPSSRVAQETAGSTTEASVSVDGADLFRYGEHNYARQAEEGAESSTSTVKKRAASNESKKNLTDTDMCDLLSSPPIVASPVPKVIIHTALNSYSRSGKSLALSSKFAKKLSKSSGMELEKEGSDKKRTAKKARRRLKPEHDDSCSDEATNTGGTVRDLRALAYSLRSKPRQVQYHFDEDAEDDSDSSESAPKAKKRKTVHARKNRNSTGSGSDFLSTEDEGAAEQRPAVIAPDGSAKWWVEKILGRRVNEHGGVEYFVQWMGYGPNYNSWEPAEGCECETLIDAYNREHGLED